MVQNQTIEVTTLSQLLNNEEFNRKVTPFLKKEYFKDRSQQIVFEEINDFVEKYSKPPTQTVLEIEIQNRRDLSETENTSALELLKSLDKSKVDYDWLLKTVEQFCKDKAVYNAVVDSIKIIEDKDKNNTPESIPSILSDALAVSFDNHIGHDYIDESERRFEYYHRKEDRIPFDLEYFNKITKGGLPNKTLNVALAGTGVGKSLFMCHMAASTLMQGKNVLYITLEMAEEKIAERIDANLMNVEIQNLPQLPKMMFNDKLTQIRKKTSGKLIIKEYPTASAHSGHFRGLIKELAIKKSFKPDIVFIDYLNICASSRFKGGANINSYTIIKSIAEELRGLAVETNVPFMSATQTTRTGFVSSDIGLEDTSESFGLPATADLMFALISTEALEEIGQMQVKQLKNRYNDPSMNKRFVVGVDRSKMRLYDVESQAQEGIVDNGQEKLNREFDEPSFGKDTKDKKYERFSKLKV